MEEEIEFEAIQSFKVNSRVHSLAWNPETSLSIVPKNLVFACGTVDHVLVYSSNMVDEPSCRPKVRCFSAC